MGPPYNGANFGSVIVQIDMGRCEYPVDTGTCGVKSKKFFWVVGEEWTEEKPGLKCLCESCTSQVREEGYELSKISHKEYFVAQIMLK